MQPISLGRVVHYRLPARYEGEARWRPAIAVNDFGPGPENLGNLTVFLDGMNDLTHTEDLAILERVGTLRGVLLSIGSAHEGTEPGDWRWPPRVG